MVHPAQGTAQTAAVTYGALRGWLARAAAGVAARGSGPGGGGGILAPPIPEYAVV